MNRRCPIAPFLSLALLVLAALAVISRPAAGAEPHSSPRQEIFLLKPETSSGLPLHQALSQRRSVRSFSPEEVGWKDISQILWAADGISRPESGKRTAPSPMATYPTTIYLANREGIYRFDPQQMKLTLIAGGDHRSRLSDQKSVQAAPLSLIVVSDTGRLRQTMDQRWKGNPENEKLSLHFCAIEAGAIAQNIYLEATSLGLATVLVGGFNRKEIEELLHLKGETVFLVMPIGHEKIGP